jgi:lipoate-protein ligase A
VSTRVWLDRAPRAAAEQMAIDTAMVKVAEHDGITLLRLYRWSGDCVSFGANESALRHWDRPLLEASAVGLVRRPTGGRAVWHDASDLTYSWTGPAATPAEVRRLYRDLHEALATAISGAGRSVALAPTRDAPGLGPGACFDLPVGGEVLVDGRKAIGSAQRVYGRRLLQHGAIAVNDRQGELSRYRLAAPSTEPSGSGASLDDAVATADQIAAAWIAAGAQPAGQELTSRILFASVEYRSHYADPAWTWRR